MAPKKEIKKEVK
jgi:hypothetical protein